MADQIGDRKLLGKTLNALCKLFGHTWLYRDYSNWIKENGEQYDFNASRKCARCKQYEYLDGTWKASNKNVRYDVQGYSKTVKHI